ncbi:MAG: MoaD/ThiS family protein [Caulobacteraceae bacterium]
MIAVSIPTQLQAYCGGATRVEAAGATIDQILRDLDRRFPGVRFRVIDEQDRIRRHMRIFVGAEPASAVDTRLRDGDEVLIFGALSGG